MSRQRKNFRIYYLNFVDDLTYNNEKYLENCMDKFKLSSAYSFSDKIGGSICLRLRRKYSKVKTIIVF
jgi:hypothetical protein